MTFFGWPITITLVNPLRSLFASGISQHQQPCTVLVPLLSRLAFESQIVWSDITKASKAVWVKGQKQKFHQLTGTTFLIYIYTRRCSSILSYHIKLLSKSEDIILCSFLEGRKKPDDGHMAYTSISISIAYLYYNWLWKFHGHLPKSKWHLSHA